MVFTVITPALCEMSVVLRKRSGCFEGAQDHVPFDPLPLRGVGPMGEHRSMEYEFEAELWEWDARRTDSWTFVSLPTDAADEILELSENTSRGFGSVRVEVTVGSTTWRTSIFPDNKTGTYVLPIKRAVREAEGLAVAKPALVRLSLVDVAERPE
jgi:hypothetical protein